MVVGGTGNSRIVLGCSRDEDGDGLIPVIGEVGNITGGGDTSGVGGGEDGGGLRGVSVACTCFLGVCLQTGTPPYRLKGLPKGSGS